MAIIAYLDPKDILAFCLVCHFTQDLYGINPSLQYRVALFVNGKEDGRGPLPMNIRDRLDYTLKRECMWKTLELDRGHLVKIALNYRHSHVHDLASGLYIFGDLSNAPDNLRTESLRFVKLPTCVHSSASVESPGHNTGWWTTIPIGVEALCIGLSLEENDLLAVLTSIPLRCTHTSFCSKIVNHDSRYNQELRRACIPIAPAKVLDHGKPPSGARTCYPVPSASRHRKPLHRRD